MSRRALLPIAAVVAALSAVPATAAAGPVFPTANDDASGLVMHERPDAGSPRTGKVPSGGQVEVLCQTTGTRQSDRKYGTSSLWDQVRNVADGRVGFVTDLYVLFKPGPDRGGPAVRRGPAASAPAPATAAAAAWRLAGRRADLARRGAGPLAALDSAPRHVQPEQVHRRQATGLLGLHVARVEPRRLAELEAPAVAGVHEVIPRGQLQPGDMLGHPGHVALFVRWAPSGRAVVREEWDYGHPAEERTWSARYTSQNTAYRYKHIRRP